MECDREIARYCRSQKSVSFADEYPNRSALASSSSSSYSHTRREYREKKTSCDRLIKESTSSSSECVSEINEDYNNVPAQFDFYQRKSPKSGSDVQRHISRRENAMNVSRMYVASSRLSRELTQKHTSYEKLDDR